MDIFLFTNFFPYKQAEPFLANEFDFTRQYSKKIVVLTLYGRREDQAIPSDDQVTFLEPLLSRFNDKTGILQKGLLNASGFSVHFRELIRKELLFSPKKLRWLITSLLITRLTLASRSFKTLVKEIESSEHPVLYFYWGDNLSWLIPYLKKRIKNQKLRIIIRLHGSDLYEQLRDNYAPLREEIFSAVDLIIPVSEYGKKYLAVKYPQITEKLFLSRLGVFDHGINPHSVQPEKVLVSVSNLIPLKRVHLIFDALQKMQGPIVWHHFGDGPLADELRALIKGSRPALDIIFHGYVPNASLIRFYKTNSVDLFLNVSTTEGLPVSIMEALSFGIPVIATDVGGTSELVSGRVGQLLPSDITGSTLAGEISGFLSREEVYIRQIRANARQTFEEKVSATKNYTALYTTLKTL